MDPLEEVKSEIAEVKKEVKAVATEIKGAKERVERAEAAGNTSEVQRWVKKEEQLLDKENKLLDKENKLLDEKARLQSAAAAGPTSAGESWRHPMLLMEDTMKQLYQRTSPVYYDNQSIGTIARIRADGLCASAGHVFVQGGKFLRCTAFGSSEPLKLVASMPYHDIIFVKGPPGPAFGLQTSELYEPGREVAIVGHPSAPARDLNIDGDPDANPAVAQGRVVMLAPTLELALADYHAAMPNSSGAPVIFDSTTLAGIHLGTSYHLDDTHHKEDPQEKPERRRVDMDPEDMFGSSKMDVQGKGKRKTMETSGLVKDVEQLALHGVRNIPHKDQLALFVPASYVANLATDIGGLDVTPLRAGPISRLGGPS